MENRHVTQALQEMLSDLPPEEQAMKILLFTERIEALEAAEPGHMIEDGNDQQGWEDIDRHEVDEPPSHRKTGKSHRLAVLDALDPSLAARFVLAGLALVGVIIILALLIFRGGKPSEPNDADNASAEVNSQYTDSVEN